MRNYQNPEFRQRVAMAVQDILDAEDYDLVPMEEEPQPSTNLSRAIATCIKEYRAAEKNFERLEALWFDSNNVMLPQGTTSSARRTLRKVRNAILQLERQADETFYYFKRDIWRALPIDDRIRRIRSMTDALLEMKVVGTARDSESAEWYANAVSALQSRAIFDQKAADEAGFKLSFFTGSSGSLSLAEVEPGHPSSRVGSWSSPRCVSV